MILPIYIYGHPVLRKETQDIDVETYENLNELITNMFETMREADGIGLAAPQIGLEDRVFVVDLTPLADEKHPEYKTFKKVFINAQITRREGKTVQMEEGCLSIPGIHENVPRAEKIRVEYLDENGQAHDEEYSGFQARVIQHEYDHIDGILFIDKISPIRKRLIKGKLAALLKGKINCHYKTVLGSK